MGSIWSTCDSEELKEKETISLQHQEKISQNSDCKLGGASLSATPGKGLCKSTNNFSTIPTSYSPSYRNLNTEVKNVAPMVLPSPQSSACKYQAQNKEFAGNMYQNRGFNQYWLDGDSYDREENGYSYSSPSQFKPGWNLDLPKKNLYNNTQNRTYQQQSSQRKDSSDFSDSSSDSDVEFSDFETFILSYSPLNPKKNQLKIPSSFQNEFAYKRYFEQAFYIELDAILEQALGEAFLSNSYCLNLSVEKRYASISDRDRDSDEAEFESEIRNDDIVLIISNQNPVPQSYKELQIRNINWTLGLINKGKNNKITISLDPRRKKSFKTSRKYIVTSIGNITPLKREYDVIGDIEYLSLGSQILNPKVCPPAREKCIPPIFMQTIRQKNYNKSQVEAIKNSIQSDGKISLIQGPPGTGKTTTVVGILSGLFAINPKSKILVCAQSNAAVDEIASTVLRKGIFDIYGDKRNDISLLRIGEKKQKHELGVDEEEEKTAEEIEMTVHSIRLSVKLENLLIFLYQ
ncbi:unnamed protein product [Blepharisma stoltei]|uniref:DNA2/NAM7 helicase helicase domain-containing protein n=1 Tax=Blepharisma stoltei TaxID=1481888 RepID=A0AAU9K796_9CILI|nr:unnamed protein product [Blepharisma stoltei]